MHTLISDPLLKADMNSINGELSIVESVSCSAWLSPTFDFTPSQMRADHCSCFAMMELDTVLFSLGIYKFDRLSRTATMLLHFPDSVLEEMRLVSTVTLKG